jgi:hypothetical protein
MPLNRLEDGTWVIDYSTISTFQLCERKGQYSYLENLTLPRLPIKMGFGQAYHAALAAYYSGAAFNDVLLAGIKVAKEYELPMSLEEDPGKSVEAIVASLRRYVQFWANEPYVTLVDPQGKPMVEITHRMMICKDPPIVYAMKMDRVCQHKIRKSIHVMDHKTTGRIHDYMQTIRPNKQFTGYLAGLVEMFGDLAESAIMNAIHAAPELKTKKRPLDEWFARAETTRNEADFEDWHRDVVEQTKRIIWTIEHNGHFPKHDPFACHVYDGCIFRDLCSQHGDETVKAALYIKRQWDLLEDEA